MKPKTKEEAIQIFENLLKKYRPGVYTMKEVGNGARKANELSLEMVFGKEVRSERGARIIHDEIQNQYHPGFSTFGIRSGEDDWAERECYLSVGWNIG